MSSKHKKQNFSLVFDKHYPRLYNYSFKMLKERDATEEVVHQAFIKLWENFDKINMNDRSIESFLIVTLKNIIIDNYRKDKTREKHINLYTLNTAIQEEIDNQWEISQQIEQIYSRLQPTTVTIFQLSRDKGLTYKEISVERNISIKTVESHISKALTAFREGLKDFL